MMGDKVEERKIFLREYDLAEGGKNKVVANLLIDFDQTTQFSVGQSYKICQGNNLRKKR